MEGLLSDTEVREIASLTSQGAKLLSWTIKKASDQTTGYLGEHYRLTLELDQQGANLTKSCFVKSVPRDNPEQAEYVVAGGVFTKEVAIYTKLFRDIDIKFDTSGSRWHPQLLYSRDDIIVLEDLSAEGYRLAASNEEPFDLDHAQVALRALALMHGQCLALEAATGREVNDLYPETVFETVYNQQNTQSAFNNWMKHGLPKVAVMADLLDGYTDQQRQVIRERLPSVLFSVHDLVQYSHRFKNCFNQGDGWSNNIMFRYEGNKPVEARVVDYQLCRYVPSTHDVMEILFLTVTKALRDEHEDTLKEFYYAELRAEVLRLGLNLDNIIPREEYLLSWQHYRKLGLFRAGILLHMVLTPAEITQNVRDMFEDFLLHKREEYIRLCFHYPFYKQRLSEIYNEIIDLYILHPTSQQGSLIK